MESTEERILPEVVREVEGDLRAELHQVHAQMRELTHQHHRARAMRRIFEHDPLTRERFTMLHDHIEQYPGKMAELREQERLLVRWLDRCRLLLDADAA
jgi:hypothetical protein